MFEWKKRGYVESDMMAMKLIEMALETVFCARVWPKSVDLKVRKAPSFDKDKPCYWYEVSMWCVLERAGSSEDVKIDITDLQVERQATGWRFAGGFGANLVINGERNHPHRVVWDYHLSNPYPNVRISYDLAPDGYHWWVGNGLTSGIVYRETPQSGDFDHHTFNIL
ncbi:MAG: hypothetical protein VKL39_14105 [Leptolyngbyaceae bacterium]|nr:hypothetical protein [Leptolyngbyaceae bacterium]